MNTPLGSDVEQVYELAGTLLEAGSYRRAQEVLTEALSRHPNAPLLLRSLSRAELGLQQWDRAAYHAYAALTEDPDNVAAMIYYARALDRLGRRHEGLWLAWRAVCLVPTSYLTHYEYANLLHRAGHAAHASIAVGEALRLDPHDPDVWALQGTILRALGRIAESDAAYRQALALQPDHAAAIHDMAINRLKAGRLSKALPGFRGAAGLDPGLGSLARANISLTLARAARRATVLATIIALPMNVAIAQLEHQEPAIKARVCVAVLTALLLGQTLFTVRLAPARSWIEALRARPILRLRALHIVATFAAAVATAISTHPFGWLDLGPPALLVAGLTIMAFGRLDNT